MNAAKQPPKEAPESCEICRYYQPYSEEEELEIESPDDYTGICRRYPPQVLTGISATSTYPDVSGATGWCGEYMPKL